MRGVWGRSPIKFFQISVKASFSHYYLFALKAQNIWGLALIENFHLPTKIGGVGAYAAHAIAN